MHLLCANSDTMFMYPSINGMVINGMINACVYVRNETLVRKQ